jgi:hypothetical protein
MTSPRTGSCQGSTNAAISDAIIGGDRPQCHVRPPRLFLLAHHSHAYEGPGDQERRPGRCSSVHPTSSTVVHHTRSASAGGLGVPRPGPFPVSVPLPGEATVMLTAVRAALAAVFLRRNQWVAARVASCSAPNRGWVRCTCMCASEVARVLGWICRRPSRMGTRGRPKADLILTEEECPPVQRWARRPNRPTRSPGPGVPGRSPTRTWSGS